MDRRRQASTVVLSPHFDDAVLSCGGWLCHHPGTVVATVCSGRPGNGVPADPAWDGPAGFTSADHAAASRRREDLDALRVLGARQVLLGFLDGSFYKEHQGRWHEAGNTDVSFERQLADSIDALLDDLEPDRCLIPLGLLHPDHVATRRAALGSLHARPRIASMVYLDLPYGLALREAAQEQRAELAAAGLQLVVDDGTDDESRFESRDEPGDRKRRAAGCYRSQLPLLEGVFGTTLERSLDPDSEQLFTIRH